MNDQQLNRALAELMGYRVSSWDTNYFMLYKGNKEISPWNTEDGAWTYAPNYSNDSVASLEVQAAAIEADPRGYIRNLAEVQHCEAGEDISLKEASANASPRERAEAAYIILNSLKE